MTKAGDDPLPSPGSLSPQEMEGCPSSSAEVSHMAPDFFFFLMCFLSFVLSSEYRKSFHLPSSMKDMFQVQSLLSTPFQGTMLTVQMLLPQEVGSSIDSLLRKINV